MPAPILDTIRDLWPTVGHLVHTIATWGRLVFPNDLLVYRSAIYPQWKTFKYGLGGRLAASELGGHFISARHSWRWPSVRVRRQSGKFKWQDWCMSFRPTHNNPPLTAWCYMALHVAHRSDSGGWWSWEWLSLYSYRPIWLSLIFRQFLLVAAAQWGPTIGLLWLSLEFSWFIAAGAQCTGLNYLGDIFLM